ncbi:hypothetical protein [Salinimicrobium soli]|uniref:hypothetical protein n=1 Tax=Salinimicrobium soli TaxID=1254399 RepID=UPI003AAC0FAD
MKKIHLLSLLFLTITACQKEEFTTAQDDLVISENLIIIQDISIEDTGASELTTVPGLQLVIEKLTQDRRKMRSKSSQGISYGIEIDSTRFRKISKGDYTSYIFLVKGGGEERGFFQNLVIAEDKSNKVKAFLLTYDMKTFKKVDGHRSFSYAGSPTISYIQEPPSNKMDDSCTPTFETWCSYGEEDHLAGNQCYYESLTHNDGRLYQKEVGCTNDAQTYITVTTEGHTESGGGDGTGGETVTTTTEPEPTGTGEPDPLEPVDKIEGDLTAPLLPLPDEEEFFDDHVFITEDFKNNPCLRSVYDDMGKASSFKTYLQKFDGDMSVADLRFGYDVNFEVNYPEQISAMAVTNLPDNNIIKIEFNGDSSLSSSIHGKPKLIVATGFIHEMLHAEVFRKMMDAVLRAEREGTTETTLNWLEYDNPGQVHHEFLASLINNYEGIHDYYTRFYYFLLNDGDPNNDPTSMDPGWQHQQISQHYRSIIVSAISEYDNHQHSSELYEALAWTGLMGKGQYDPETGLYENSTEAWKNLDPDPAVAAQKRIAIRNMIVNFKAKTSNKCV